MGGDGGWESKYEDPLRWKSAGAAAESRIAGTPRVDSAESSTCSVKLVVMHRPTHEPAREKTCEYPYAWHLFGRKRLWELRFQLRFKQPPSGQLFFGLELEKYVPVSGVAKSAQKMLVSACRGVVGPDCYHSPGDDPSRVSGELELPTFVMPLWAFDQFIVSEVGEEPPLEGNLDKVGFMRANNSKEYIRQMQAAIDSFSVDKVYTFCFWGISQFLDVMQWKVVGGILPMPGVKMDFNKLCGSPPIHLSIYQMPKSGPQDTDRRHLPSRKTYFFKVAVWSNLVPLAAGALQQSSQGADIFEAASPEQVAALNAVNDWDNFFNETGPPLPEQSPTTQQETTDLLGMFDAPAPAAQPSSTAAPAQKVESVDLLGLDM